MSDFLAQQRMTSQMQAFVMAMQFARSEAVKRGVDAFVVPTDNSDADNEWGQGWCVTLDADNCDTPIRVFEGLADRSVLDAPTGGPENRVRFNNQGLLVEPAGGFTMDLCSSDEDVNPGRQLQVSLVGRTAVTEVVCGAVTP